MRAGLWIVGLVGLLAVPGCDDPTQPPPDPSDDDDGDDDDTDTGPLVPVSATVGPAGGTLALADGTAVVIPPGALAQEVELTITPTERVATPWDDTMLPLGTAFLLAPSIVAEDGSVFEYRVPLGAMPAGVGAADAIVALQGPGIIDGADSEGEADGAAAEVLIAWSAPQQDAGFAVFASPAFPGATTIQGMIRAAPLFARSPAPPSGRDGAATAQGLLVGCPCSQSVALEFGAAAVPPDIDAVVALAPVLFAEPAFVAWYAAWVLDDEAAAIAAMNRFSARLCLATWRSVAMYRSMGAAWIPTPVPLNATFSATSSGRALLGYANGLGVTVTFANADRTPTYSGSDGAAGSPDGWNTPPAGDALTHVDQLDLTVAHEVAHYVQFWATRSAVVLPTGSLPLVIEGGAEALAEEVFDAPETEGPGFPLWSFGLTTPYAAGRAPPEAYESSVFWRFLDWAQETPARDGHPLIRLLSLLRLRSVPLGPVLDFTRGDLHQLAAALFPSSMGYDFDEAVTDFAVAWLYGRDFERAPAGGSALDADRYVDATGVRLDEEAAERLWGTHGALAPAPRYGPWRDGLAVEDIYPPPLDVPVTFSLPADGADVAFLSLLAVQLTVESPGVSLSFRAVSGASPRGEISVRVLREVFGEPPSELWRIDSLSLDPAQPTTLSIPATIGAGAGVLAVVAVNHEPSPVVLDVRVSALPRRVLALGRDVGLVDTLRVYDVDGTTLSPRPLGPQAVPALSTGLGFRAGAVCEVGAQRAVVSLTDAEVAVYALAEGFEGEIDTDFDASNGVTRIDLTPFGLSEPRGVACAHLAPRAFVAAREGIAVISTLMLRVVAVVPWTALGITDSARPYRLAVKPDDSRLYATLWNLTTGAETRTVVLSVPGMLGPQPFTNLVLAEYVRPGDAGTGRHLGLSGDGRLLSTTVPAAGWVDVTNTLTDADLDPGGPGLPLHYGSDPAWPPSLGPVWTAWTPGEEAFYVGYSTGGLGTALATNGVVRRCDPSETYCDHSVGVECGVRALAVAGSAGSEVVVVADACGYLTALPRALFEAGGSTSGWALGCSDGALYDGTGGCLDVTSCPTKPNAISCTDTFLPIHLGMPAVDLIAY